MRRNLGLRHLKMMLMLMEMTNKANNTFSTTVKQARLKLRLSKIHKTVMENTMKFKIQKEKLLKIWLTLRRLNKIDKQINNLDMKEFRLIKLMRLNRNINYQTKTQ